MKQNNYFLDKMKSVFFKNIAETVHHAFSRDYVGYRLSLHVISDEETRTNKWIVKGTSKSWFWRIKHFMQYKRTREIRRELEQHFDEVTLN